MSPQDGNTKILRDVAASSCLAEAGGAGLAGWRLTLVDGKCPRPNKQQAIPTKRPIARPMHLPYRALFNTLLINICHF